MNAALHQSEVPAELADAREETYRLLQSVAHYCHCAQMHLEVADDGGALWDFSHAKQYFASAVRRFEAVRAAMRLRTDQSEDAS